MRPKSKLAPAGPTKQTGIVTMQGPERQKARTKMQWVSAEKAPSAPSASSHRSNVTSSLADTTGQCSKEAPSLEAYRPLCLHHCTYLA